MATVDSFQGAEKEVGVAAAAAGVYTGALLLYTQNPSLPSQTMVTLFKKCVYALYYNKAVMPDNTTCWLCQATYCKLHNALPTCVLS